MATYSEDQPLLAVPTPTAAPPGGGAPPACQPDGTELSITAQNLQFDTDCLAAPAGEALSIEFDNQDAGVPHNLGIYTDPSATEELFKGDTVTGVDSTTYQIDAIDQEGTLHFQCDFHPTTMTGTFVVAAA
jgi:plastocyanin